MDSLPPNTNQFSDTQEPAASPSQRQAVPVNYPELLATGIAVGTRLLIFTRGLENRKICYTAD